MIRDVKQLSSEFTNTIFSVVTALVMFSISSDPPALPLKDGGKTAPDFLAGTFVVGKGKERSEANIGRPIVYNRG